MNRTGDLRRGCARGSVSVVFRVGGGPGQGLANSLILDLKGGLLGALRGLKSLSF